MRAIRVALAYEPNTGTHLVIPGGHSANEYRALRLQFGALSGTVIESLRTVGIPELNVEFEALINRVGHIDGDQATIALSADPVDRGLFAWRVLALWARVAEDLAAFLFAVDGWLEAGQPRAEGCEIGRTFLQWRPDGSADIRGALRAHASAAGVRRLMFLPGGPELTRFVSADHAAAVGQVTERSARDVAAWLMHASELVDETSHRVFNRWKHRISATTPGRVPLWVRIEDSDIVEAAASGLLEGIAVIDWPLSRRATGPELIVWRTPLEEIEDYLLAAAHGINVFGMAVDALARFWTRAVPAVPWMASEPLSPAETEALVAIETSGYREWLATNRT